MPKDNYLKILQNIKKQGDITLVAVTKNRLFSEVQELYDAGCRDFGENRFNDALPKIQALPNDINWHFIGTLQKNKVRKVISNFKLIHGVDSLELARKISECSQEMGVTTSILLQVNTSGELSKHGFSEQEFLACFAELKSLSNINIEGLMTMAPLTDDEAVIRNCFSRLRSLKESLNLKHLSMGMSHDYKIAIEEGATIVRIGSALFS